MKKSASSLLAVATMALGIALVAPAGTASAAAVPIDLYAVTGNTTLPGGASVPVWGYNTSNTAVTQPGGPTLQVDVGDVVTITLHNQLTERSGLQFRGQSIVPDFSGAAPGGTATYEFTADEPGTYLYEAGLLPGAEYQSSMGLYGALVVSPGAGQAYPSITFDDEAVLVLSEIDPKLNNSATPETFDMRKFAPKYSLLNGVAYPDTTNIATTAGSDVLLRYVNAGTQYRSMATLGADQSVIALDGSPYNYARQYVAETFGPGQTADALVTAPTAGVDEKLVPVYDGSLLLHNSNVAGAGGILTFIAVPGTGAPGDNTGPVTSAVAYDGANLTATVDDTATGGSSIQAAEYFMDTLGAPGTGTAMTGGFTSVSENVTAPTAVPPGQHIYYVRGQDAQSNWGPFSSVLVNGADIIGPSITDAKLIRTPTNGIAPNSKGLVQVKVRATADDTENGGSVIDVAEYSIDGGTPQTMNVNKPDLIASVVGTIDQATLNTLSEGSHTVAIRAQDSAGNWGDPFPVELIVDRTGPDATGITVQPDPNNGTIPFNPSTPAVRVDATLTDPVSGGVNSEVRKGEAFIDTVTADGTGIVLAPVDGVYDGMTEVTPGTFVPGEDVYADIPLATIAQLTNGDHTIYVHGKDQAKNWGPMSSTTLTIDKQGPQITAGSVTAAPNPTGGANNVALTADVTDNLSTVVAGQWWIGSVAPANRNPMTVNGGGTQLSATVNVAGFSPGNYRIKVRAQDSVGNWGKRKSVVLVVTP